MQELMHFIRQFTVWLHTPLCEYGWFYLDLWSIPHFWSGMIIFAGLSALKWKKRWNWLIFFLLAFEVVEAVIFISIMKMFRPEKLPDTFTDIILGVAGGYLVYLLYEKWKLSYRYSRLFLFLLTSCTVSFLWTGNYGYIFTDPKLNTPGINWWVLLCWVLVGMLMLYFYEQRRMTGNNNFRALAITWIAYLLPMLILTNIADATKLLAAGEVMQVKHKYIIGFFPGDATKALFYLLAPLFFIYLYRVLLSLFKRYTSKLSINVEK